MYMVIRINNMETTKNDQINQFIINTVLVNPIEKILSKLKAKEYRDCDIKWLDAKLSNFILFAAQTLNINCVIADLDKNKFSLMNEYAYNYYTDKFTKLLAYFKSF